jgi:hypothetical protein
MHPLCLIDGMYVFIGKKAMAEALIGGKSPP